MAEIVLGIGASHGPLLSTAPEQWDLRAKADRENRSHWYRGKSYDYESLLKLRAPGFADVQGELVVGFEAGLVVGQRMRLVHGSPP